MCTVPMKPLPITAVPMSMRRVTGGAGPPGGRIVPSSCRRFSGQDLQSGGCQPGVARCRWPPGCSADARSCLIGRLSPSCSAFSGGHAYFHMSSAEVPRPASRDTRIIPPWAAARSHPATPSPGPSPKRWTRSSPSSTRSAGPLAVARRGLPVTPPASPHVSTGAIRRRRARRQGGPGRQAGGRPPAGLAAPAKTAAAAVAASARPRIDVAVSDPDGRILGHHEGRPSEQSRTDRSGGARSGRGAVRPVARGRRGGLPAVGHRHRRARDRSSDRHRPADLAADHARLGRVSDVRERLRGPLQRAGLGRQRRQRARARRVARASGPAPDNVVVVKVGTGIGAGSSWTGSSVAGPKGRPGTSATSRCSRTGRA